MNTRGQALAALSVFPRRRVASLPTPLIAAPLVQASLAAERGCPCPELLIKMDCETGVALGGNKVRKLEFELSEANLRDTTCLITAGAVQSNHCRITAGMAARLGLRCIIVVNGPDPKPHRGNALLYRLFGAEVRVVPGREDRLDGMEAAAAEVRDQGGVPHIIPLGDSTQIGALGYANAAVELVEQLARFPSCPHTWLFVCASSCGTLAGLVLGFALLGRSDVRLVGMSADLPQDEVRQNVLQLARDAALLLDFDFDSHFDPLTLQICADYAGEAYGVPTAEGDAAAALFGRCEALVLDPVYTAKVASGMLGWLRARDKIPPSDRAVFLHTGGHPAVLSN